MTPVPHVLFLLLAFIAFVIVLPFAFIRSNVYVEQKNSGACYRRKIICIDRLCGDIGNLKVSVIEVSADCVEKIIGKDNENSD